jgi:hypothetical protein
MADKLMLTDIRPRIAAIFRTTEPALHQRQKYLYTATALAEAGMNGHRGRDAGPLATPATAGILLLTALLGDNRFTIADRVAALWTARRLPPHPKGIFAKCRTLGAAMQTLLTIDKTREEFQFMQIEFDVPRVAFRFVDNRELRYSPLTQRQIGQRLAELGAATGYMALGRVKRGAFDRVAAMLQAPNAQSPSPPEFDAAKVAVL